MERTKKIPGFVDLQVNGFMGIDFSSPDLNEEKFIAACRMVHDAGTTAFLPTIVTSPENEYRKNISLMAQIMDMPEFAGILLTFTIGYGINKYGRLFSAVLV